MLMGKRGGHREKERGKERKESDDEPSLA